MVSVTAFEISMDALKLFPSFEEIPSDDIPGKPDLESNLSHFHQYAMIADVLKHYFAKILKPI